MNYYSGRPFGHMGNDRCYSSSSKPYSVRSSFDGEYRRTQYVPAFRPCGTWARSLPADDVTSCFHAILPDSFTTSIWNAAAAALSLIEVIVKSSGRPAGAWDVPLP